MTQVDWKEHEYTTGRILDGFFSKASPEESNYFVLSDINIFDPLRVLVDDLSYTQQLDHLMHFTSAQEGDADIFLIINAKNLSFEALKTSLKLPLEQFRKHKETFHNYTKTFYQKSGNAKREIRHLAVTNDSQELSFLTPFPSNEWVIGIDRLKSETPGKFIKKVFSASYSPLKIYDSPVLKKLAQGVAVLCLGHPHLVNAIHFINDARKQFDTRLLTQTLRGKNPDVDIAEIASRKSLSRKWMFNGFPGTGKTVLLAHYALELSVRGLNVAVAAPRKDISKAIRATIEWLLPYRNQESFPVIQDIGERLSYIGFYDAIPENADAVLIDEAQDMGSAFKLSTSVKEVLEREGGPYIRVFCDGFQKVKDYDDDLNESKSSDGKIVSGISFSRQSSRLGRIYRNPVPIFWVSLQILYRWQISHEARRPIIETVKSLENLLKINDTLGISFKNWRGENDYLLGTSEVRISQDFHPASNWRNLVRCFTHYKDVENEIIESRLFHHDCLWIKIAASKDISKISTVYLVDVRNPDWLDRLANIVDSNVKGNEFNVVIIELDRDLVEFEDDMTPGWADYCPTSRRKKRPGIKSWRFRGCLYTICSRSRLALWFILPERSQSEIGRIIQNTTPSRGADGTLSSAKSAPGTTWTIRIENTSDHFQPNDRYCLHPDGHLPESSEEADGLREGVLQSMRNALQRVNASNKLDSINFLSGCLSDSSQHLG